jgi:D-glycero-alpha-D-manno-heptose-7-phosphate kinase
MLIHDIFQRRYRMKYSAIEEADTPAEINHPLLREVLLRHWNGNPLEIASVADVPAGTGMGSSGAFTVCLLRGLAYARRTTIAPGPLAEAACEIEIDVLKEPVGKQDQYVAAHGGICAYSFKHDGGVQVEPLALDAATLRHLRDQMLLFYTGQARSASQVLSDQDRRSLSGDPAMLKNLHVTKELGLKSRDLLIAGDVEGYADLMHEHWMHKRERSAGMANERIDSLYSLARSNGVLGGKLVGAGGGGFLLVYSARPEETRRAMEGAGAQELPFDFEFGGAYASEYT